MLNKVKRKVVKYGQSYQSWMLPCGIHQDEPQYCRTLPHWQFILRQESLCTPETLRWIIHRYYGDAIDLQRFGEIGKKGVLALMCDSTNAERPGFTMSERTVGKTFDEYFRGSYNITELLLQPSHPM